MAKTKSRGNGEGTIFQRQVRGKKKWVCEYTLGYDDNGKRKYKTIYGDTRQDVKEKLEGLITELKTDTYVDKSNIIFKDITKEFIDTGFKMNKLCEASYGRKLGTLNQIEGHYMANMEIQKITERDVKDFLIYITKYSNSVISKIYGLVNSTFKIAVRRKIIANNPLDNKMELCKPTSQRKDKDVRGFTVEEQRQFLDVVLNNKVKYKHQLLLSLFTGMRMRRN